MGNNVLFESGGKNRSINFALLPTIHNEAH